MIWFVLRFVTTRSFGLSEAQTSSLNCKTSERGTIWYWNWASMSRGGVSSGTSRTARFCPVDETALAAMYPASLIARASVITQSDPGPIKSFTSTIVSDAYTNAWVTPDVDLSRPTTSPVALMPSAMLFSKPTRTPRSRVTPS